MIDYRQAARVVWYCSGGFAWWIAKNAITQALDDIKTAWATLTNPDTWQWLTEPEQGYIEGDIWTEPEDNQELQDAKSDLADYYYLLDMATERYETAGRPATRETAKRQIIAYRNKIRRLESRIEQLKQEGN